MKIAEDSGSEISKKTWEWIKIVLGVEGPENTIENWNKYREVVCSSSEEENKKQFNEFFQIGGEYWLEVCFNMFSKGCKTAEKAAVSIQFFTCQNTLQFIKISRTRN
ncbi:hypothetical protein AVEN_62821-1 [Araneus ventricosus]|uniref:Uncharacterized protein n=1 Tax=Araneus ventricosus TaxID=182803 RepID=A0A4Y2S4A3_ARAVE|nr:hypothetical protein AVEN_62821-1 [Araneus ventricosus]